MASSFDSDKTPTKLSKLLNISPKSKGCICILCGNFIESASNRRKLFVGSGKTENCLLIEKVLKVSILRECSTHTACRKCVNDVTKVDNSLNRLISSYEKTALLLYDSHGSYKLKRLRPQEETPRRKSLFQDNSTQECATSEDASTAAYQQRSDAYRVHILTPDGQQRTVIHSLTPLALALTTPDFKHLSSVICGSDCLKDHIVKDICNILQQEISNICSKHEDSILRSSDAVSLLNFTWENVAAEWKVKAPTFWRLLQIFSSNPCLLRNKHKDEKSLLPTIVSASCKLISAYNRDLNALQHLNNVLLLKGGAKKSLFNRLYVTGDCLSYKTSTNDIEKFASEWNGPIIAWKKQCHEDRLEEQKLMDNVSKAQHLVSDNGASPYLIFLLDQEETVLKIHREQMHSGYYFVGDNVDFYTKVRTMSQSNQNKSQHMYQMCAYKNRVPGNDLDDSGPKQNPKTVPFSTFQPSEQEHSVLLSELAQIVAWKWTEFIPCLQCFAPVLPEHIPHKYMNETKQKTERINLGVLEKNEQYNDQMSDICEYLHTFVPGHDESEDKSKTPQKTLSGGDYLTFERHKSAQSCQSNGFTPSKKLQGLIPKMEEFHNQAEFLKLIWKQLYKTSSSTIHGSLYAARNRIDAKNVPTDPHTDYYAASVFMEKVTTAYIVAGGLHHFKMDSMESKAQPEYIGPVGDKESMQQYIMEHALAFVETHCELDVPKLPDYGPQCIELSCRYCGKNYVKPLSLRKHEAKVHAHTDPKYNPHSEARQTSAPKRKSTVYDYTKQCLTLGLLRLNHNDAIKMGDGERMLKIAKYFCMYYKACNCPKYAYGLLETIAQTQTLLSPRQAERLIWNRTVNHQGRKDTNHPNDLDLEHCNKVFKEDVRTYRGKYTEKTILRVSRSALKTDQICKKYDRLCQVRQNSGKHTSTDVSDDILCLVDQFHRNGKVFDDDPEKVNEIFASLRDPLKTLNMQDIQEWISASLQQFSRKTFYKY